MIVALVLAGYALGALICAALLIRYTGEYLDEIAAGVMSIFWPALLAMLIMVPIGWVFLQGARAIANILPGKAGLYDRQ